MHWRFVILYRSGCYWQSAIVCLVFKVKKKARQTIYCFTLHRLLIAYYWTKNDTNVIHIITHLYPALPCYAFLLTSTVQFYCTEFTYQQLLRCTPLHRTLTIKPLYTTVFSLTRTVCNCTPPHIPTESPRGRCTGLWPALYPTVHHCTIHLPTLYQTERHSNWH